QPHYQSRLRKPHERGERARCVRLEYDCPAAVGFGVRGFETLRNHIELGLRVCQRDARREASDDLQTEVGPAAIIAAAHARIRDCEKGKSDLEVRREVDAAEAGYRDTNYRSWPAVQNDGLADDIIGPVELVLPDVMGDDRGQWCAA